MTQHDPIAPIIQPRQDLKNALTGHNNLKFPQKCVKHDACRADSGHVDDKRKPLMLSWPNSVPIHP